MHNTTAPFTFSLPRASSRTVGQACRPASQEDLIVKCPLARQQAAMASALSGTANAFPASVLWAAADKKLVFIGGYPMLAMTSLVSNKHFFLKLYSTLPVTNVGTQPSTRQARRGPTDCDKSPTGCAVSPSSLFAMSRRDKSKTSAVARRRAHMVEGKLAEGLCDVGAILLPRGGSPAATAPSIDFWRARQYLTWSFVCTSFPTLMASSG